MFSHITLGTNDRARAERFYAAVLPVLGLQLQLSSSDYFAYGPAAGGRPRIFIFRPFDGRPASSGNGFHVAFLAATTEAVDQFHAAAIAAGGTDEGAAGPRPNYSPDYYGGYVRDPDGNKLQAVCYMPARRAGPTGETISHITIGTDDLERAGAFYEPLFATLGYARLTQEESPDEDLAFGIAGTQLPVTFVQYPFDGAPPRPGNGQHAAFSAPSREAVDRFHATALSLGGSDEGAPGLRPHYHADYYAAYVRDPRGSKLQAVCHKPQ